MFGLRLMHRWLQDTWGKRDRLRTLRTSHRRSGLWIEALEDRITPSLTADYAEPNNLMSSATYLGRGGPQTWSGLTIDSPTDVDWLSFRLDSAGQAGNSVGVSFTNADGNLDIDLFDADGNWIDGSYTISDTQSVNLAGRAAGLYYLKVYGFKGATNTYTFNLNGPALFGGDYLESNNTSGTAFTMPSIVNGFTLNNLSIHDSSDSDWFYIQLQAQGNADSEVSINFSNTQGDLDLELYKADGVTLLDTSETSTDTETISLNGLAAGGYYVRVAGYQGATNPNYSFFARGPAAGTGDRFEPNNIAASATNLGTLTSRRVEGNLSIHDSTDQDWFKFQIPNQGTTTSKVRIDFEHALGDLDLYLYGPDGANLLGVSSGVDGFEELSLAGYQANTDYYIKVVGYEGATNKNYTLSITPPIGIGPDAYEPNNSIASAVDLGTVNGVVSRTNLNIDVSSDIDWFKFSLSRTGQVGNYARINFLHTLGDLDMVLYGSDGITVRATSTTVDDGEEVSLQGLTDGSYYLRVFGYQGATNPNYSLVVSGPTGVTADPNESNDTRGTATDLGPITGSMTRSGLSIHTSSDIDWYRFSLPSVGESGNYVRLDFANVDGNIDMQLFGGDGVTLLGSAQTQGDQEQISLNGLAIGSYFLRVYGYQGAINPRYDLTINGPGTLVADRYESPSPNNTAATATNLGRVIGPTPRVESNLSIHSSSDEDWFGFETIANSTTANSVRIDFNTLQGDLDLELYSASNPQTPLIGRFSTSTNNFEEISLDGLGAGKYLVRVFGYNGGRNPNYTLTITAPEEVVLPADRLEINNTSATATVLRTGTGTTLIGSRTEADLTINSNDTDWYKFTTAAQGTNSNFALISYLGVNGQLRLDLYDSPNSTPLRSSASLSGDTQAVSLNGLAAGTYYLRVSGQNNAINRYSLRVDAPNDPAKTTLDAWTIMFYMTASNLTSAAWQDINQLEAAAARMPGTVNITVLWDQSAARSVSERYATGNGTQPAWGTAGMSVITPDINPDMIASTFVSANPANPTASLSDPTSEANTGDPSTLASFLRWSASNAPAQRYALVMWDHGSGLYGSNYDNADGSITDNLNLAELTAALSQTGVPQLSSLSFEASLQGLIENAYTLRTLAPIYSASQEVAWVPYLQDSLLFNSFATVTDPYQVTPEQLVMDLVRNTEVKYSGTAPDGQYTQSDTYSAINATKLNSLTAAILGFTRAAGNATSPDILLMRSARDAATAFDFTNSTSNQREYRDLGQFMQAIANASGMSANIRSAAQAVLTALTDAVIGKTNDSRNVSGLSIYLPSAGPIWSGYTTTYSAFNTATEWAGFLNRLINFNTAGPANPTQGSGNWEEPNNTFPQSYDLRTVTSSQQFTGLSLNLATDTNGINGVDQDWYRFSITGPGQASNSVIVYSLNPADTMQIVLFNSLNQQVGSPVTGSGVLTLSLNGLPIGTYSVRISTTGTTPIVNYTMVIDAPGSPTGTDWVGDNSSLDKAFNIGSIVSGQAVTGLSVPMAGNDWYSFQTPVLPSSQLAQVRVNVAGSLPVTASILDSSGNLIATGTGVGTIVLSYRQLGRSESYSLRVQGSTGGAVNYWLNFTTATNVPQSLLGRTASGEWWIAENSSVGMTNRLATKWNPSAGWHDIQTADFNGDGRVDLLGRTAGGEWWLAVNTGSGFTNQLYTTWNEAAGWKDIKVGDFNSDGKLDLLGRTANGEWWLAVNTGTSFSNIKYTTWNEAAGWKDVTTGDFNGDGKLDVLGRTAGGEWWLGVNTGSAFVNQLYTRWNEAAGWSDVQFADIDGDGKLDVLGRTTAGEWWLGRNTGTAFVNELYTRWNSAAGWHDTLVGDFNGDGKLDLLSRTVGGEWWLARNTGSGFTNDLYTRWNESAGWRDVMAGDFNGDGKLDVIGRTAAGQWWVGANTGSAFTNVLFTAWNELAGWKDVRSGIFI